MSESDLADWNDDDVLEFVSGIPNFRKWSWDQKNFTLTVKLTGHQATDKRLVASELANQGWQGAKSQREVLAIFTRERITPHHFQMIDNDTHVIQLADMDLHDLFRKRPG